MAIAHIRAKFSGQRAYFFGIGMSLGANFLLRTAGEQGKALTLDALISLNNPFDVWLAVNLMRETPYEKYLASELKHLITGKLSMPEQEKGVIDELLTKHRIDIEKIKLVNSWRDWDEHLTSKAFPGYKTVADYYLAASSLSKIKHIEVPTLVIHSKDDPIVPFECLPTSECLTNPKIIVATVEKGGHVCYFQGAKGQKRWYPFVSAEFLHAVIQVKEEGRRKRESDIREVELASV